MLNNHISSKSLKKLFTSINEVANSPIGVGQTALAAVEQLQHLLPSDSSVLGYRRASDGIYFGFSSPEDYPVADYGEAYQAHVEQHPFVQHYKKAPNSDAVRFSDVVNTSSLRDRAIHSEFFKPLKIKRLLGKVVPVDDLNEYQFNTSDGCFVYGSTKPTFDYSCIAVGLGRDGTEFSLEDTAVFNLFVSTVSAQLMRELRWELETQKLNTLSNQFETQELENFKKIVSHCKLTKRQAEVFEWLGKGKTNAEIAMILDNSPRTVQAHVEAILFKLGVENRVTAARMLWSGF